MGISDREFCLQSLEQIGYYRLSAYWYPFRYREAGHREGIDSPSEQITADITLDDIIATYEIDRRFRNIIFDAIERIEVALRVSIANQLGQNDKYGFDNEEIFSASSQAQSQHLPNMTNFQAFTLQQREYAARSREDFVVHHRNKYDGKMPVWVAIEVWDFGTILDCYRMLKAADKEQISLRFHLAGTRTLGGWIDSMRILRNTCAHHARLNRRHFNNAPRFPGGKHDVRFRQFLSLNDKYQHRLYGQILMIATLLDSMSKQDSFAQAITDIVDQMLHIRCINLTDYGFPEDWQTSPLWKQSDHE